MQKVVEGITNDSSKQKIFASQIDWLKKPNSLIMIGIDHI
jgi:hypothetical protein